MNFDVQFFSLIANISALTLIGILYAAYIKNIKSELSVKDEKLSLAEQNTKLWKDRVLELKRRTPSFVEKVLNDRIKIIEQEVERLSKDGSKYNFEIHSKNEEIDKLKSEAQIAKKFSSSIMVYDSNEKDFIEIPTQELTVKTLGDIWVDSASLLICDSWHLLRPRELEIEEHSSLKYCFEDIVTGEVCCVDDDTENAVVEELDAEMTFRELVELGRLRELEVPKELPAFPDTYIKNIERKSYKLLINKGLSHTFYNGHTGAGISIGTRGDGWYTVKAELYQGEIQRIYIDFS